MPHGPFSPVGPRALIRAKHVTELQQALEDTPSVSEVGDVVHAAIADSPTVIGIVTEATTDAIISQDIPGQVDAEVTTNIAGRNLVEAAPTLDDVFAFGGIDPETGEAFASWLAALLKGGGVPQHSADAILDATMGGARTHDSYFGDVWFAFGDAEGRPGALSMRIDGTFPQFVVDDVQRRLAEVAIPNCTHEWWILQAYTWLGNRLVGTTYDMTDGTPHAIEWTPGMGVTTNALLAPHDGNIDDHNAPGHWAADGERMVVVWALHNYDTKLRVQVSQPGPDVASLAESPIYEFDLTDGVSYGQLIRIDHLSDETRHTFWCPTRVGGTTRWNILAFEVDRATGAVTQTGFYHFVQSVGQQLYCSFADAYADGNQTLRVAAYHNPARPTNQIWYLDVDCVTGEVTSPYDPGLSFDVRTASSPIVLSTDSGTTTLVIPALDHDAGVDRRMFYVSAGPFPARIAYAEWEAADADSAVYKVLDIATGTVTDYGEAGTRFGYTAEGNYLPGMAFPNPAYDDTVYLARNPGDGPSTLEAHWTGRDGATSAVLATQAESVVTRPIAPLHGGPLILYYDMTSYGVASEFASTGTTRSARRR